jgi:hypothetical protein
MTAGLIVIGCLAGMCVLLTGYAIYGLGKMRMDQGMELGLLKWLWEKELTRQKDKGFK